MKGFYRVRINNEVKIYTNAKDIPESFDNLIDFAPEYPIGPHTDEEHETIHRMSDVLQELLQREMK